MLNRCLITRLNKPHVKKLPRQSEEGYRQKKEGGSEEVWEGNKEMTKFMQEKDTRVRRCDPNSGDHSKHTLSL